MADDLDLLTESEALQAVKLPESSMGNNDTLAMMVTAISRRIDELCGPVVVRTITGERHTGRHRIWFDKAPVDTVTTVVEWSGATSTTLTAESGATRPASGYLLIDGGNVNAHLLRRSSGSTVYWAAGDLNIVVTYDAGRAEDTVSVDAKFKMAAASILRRCWQREAAAWVRTSDFGEESGVPDDGFFLVVDPMVREWLADELIGPSVGAA